MEGWQTNFGGRNLGKSYLVQCGRPPRAWGLGSRYLAPPPTLDTLVGQVDAEMSRRMLNACTHPLLSSTGAEVCNSPCSGTKAVCTSLSTPVVTTPGLQRHCPDADAPVSEERLKRNEPGNVTGGPHPQLQSYTRQQPTTTSRQAMTLQGHVRFLLQTRRRGTRWVHMQRIGEAGSGQRRSIG